MESLHEEWRPVIGLENKFEVSDAGRVKALPHEIRHWCGRMIPKPGGILKQSKHSGGYSVVSLRDEKKHFVHRLVMAAFVGAPNGQDVNHINGDKRDNRLGNLEYCDRLHNVRHAITTGLQDNSGEGNGMHLYTTEQIQRCSTLRSFGYGTKEISRETGVSVAVIESVFSGARWKHLGLSTAN